MHYFEYDTYDKLHAALRDCRRTDMSIYLPYGGSTITTAAAEFWLDVLARFRRGEWQDAVTAVERRFEARMGTPDARQRAILNSVSGKRRAA